MSKRTEASMREILKQTIEHRDQYARNADHFFQKMVLFRAERDELLVQRDTLLRVIHNLQGLSPREKTAAYLESRGEQK